MARKVTIFTGQFGDLKSDELFQKMSECGFDGLELACGTDHFDVRKCLNEEGYCEAKKAQLEKYGLGCWAISNHCVGQGVLDETDERTLAVIPEYLRSSDLSKVWENCAEEMKLTARAAAKFGVKVVNGFTGSSIWKYFYSWPPVPQEWIDQKRDS